MSLIKTDYWTCPTCGTDYGYDDSQCHDPVCKEIAWNQLSRDLQDQIKEDRGREERDLPNEPIGEETEPELL